MSAPQPGIFALGTRVHHHLEFDLRPAADPGALGCLATLWEPKVTGGATNLVIGFGAGLWEALAPGPLPEGLGSFTEVRGGDRVAPATQHDVWVWVHGSGTDEVLDTVRAATEGLEPSFALAAETAAFVYHDSRDLTGFIDGSANPPPSEAPDVALVPADRPGGGGSHVLVQRWVHDLASFGALPVEEQERVIGRTKLDSVALDRAVRPVDAHISRAEIHDAAGEERPIYRRSTPFGSAAEQGLLFLAFSAERDRFDGMLAQMYASDGVGPQDRLLGYSAPTSGAYYFAPGLEELEAL